MVLKFENFTVASVYNMYTTGFPDWVTKIVVVWESVSHSASDEFIVQIGNSTGFLSGQYKGYGENGPASVKKYDTDGWPIENTAGSTVYSGQITIERGSPDSLVWMCHHTLTANITGGSRSGGGMARNNSGAAIDRIQIQNEAGSGNWDAGSWTVWYE